MDKKIKEIAKEVYTIGHKTGNCKGCPFENCECDFLRCSGSSTVESITGQIERKYTKSKDFVETIENYEVPILDEIEKRYLTNLLRPFVKKYKIEVTKKESCFKDGKAFLHIMLNPKNFDDSDDCFDLPFFDIDKMYKGMEVKKDYTLKELSLKF